MAHQEHWNHGSSYYTPRSIAPHPGYFPTFAPHDYPEGDTYAISSHSTSARGRSGSGTSTASVGYTLVSPATAPTSPLHLLSGAARHCQATHGDQVTRTEGSTPASPKRSYSVQLKQEPLSVEGTKAKCLANFQTIVDDRMFCRHRDCLDEDGQPKKFFSRKADVTRHYKSRHDVTYIDCPKRNCERKGRQGFTRRDHLTEHLRGFHMELIAKRHNKVKKKEPDSNEDSNESNSSAEDLGSTDSTVELLPAVCSRRPSLGSQGDQNFKQEFQVSSDEEAEDSFPVDDVYQPSTSQRPRTALHNLANKTKGRRGHPYQRRPSKTQQPQGASSEANMAHHASLSPEFVSSKMTLHSPVYATHHGMSGPYTASHIMSPMYTTHHDMDSFYASSIAQTYHGPPAPHGPSYRVTHPDDFGY
ncbi:hypothetical protein A1O7_04105 [Cladophialophora yegresii CBS 114405]|uniref:C2H2-type domain-containing protein n=1 Tax=Cladophialophora yegresii CBS 114405 TaxID=1182544 RepID=W9VVW3_9EURO|nr:uncharacterized protein A1O7_04105 [Cladophialophora yegresii CBS 114405]EXJ59957.1 hypothetical protein A1O7_04105 [Cladophialophora yegresii CBS 114405]